MTTTAGTAEPVRNVLIAMDESHHSDDAFNFYMKNMHKPHMVLLYVPEHHTVIQSPVVMTDVSVVTDLLQEEEKKIKGFLEQLRCKLKHYGIGGKVKSVGGNPGEIVCKVANEEMAHLVVLGSRGMGTIRRTFLRSVSDYFMHHAHIPVLVQARRYSQTLTNNLHWLSVCLPDRRKIQAAFERVKSMYLYHVEQVLVLTSKV